MAAAPVLYTLLLAKQEILAANAKISALEGEVASLKELVDTTPEALDVTSISLSDEAGTVTAVLNFDAQKNVVLTMGEMVTTIMKANGDLIAAGNVGGNIVLEETTPAVDDAA